MRPRRKPTAGSGRRILFPFIGSTVSQATLDATLRLARSQDATLVPAYLVIVPQHLSLESPAPVRECEAALPVLELIDQRASRAGVPVDSRIERGRTHRHALASLHGARALRHARGPREDEHERWLRAGGRGLAARERPGRGTGAANRRSG